MINRARGQESETIASRWDSLSRKTKTAQNNNERVRENREQSDKQARDQASGAGTFYLGNMSSTVKHCFVPQRNETVNTTM